MAVSHLAPGATVEGTRAEIGQGSLALGECVRGTRCQRTVTRATVAVPDCVAVGIKGVGEDV
eukprot:scaffold28402_cov68-Phaeocystis_antarctica.AAC.5